VPRARAAITRDSVGHTFAKSLFANDVSSAGYFPFSPARETIKKPFAILLPDKLTWT